MVSAKSGYVNVKYCTPTMLPNGVRLDRMLPLVFSSHKVVVLGVVQGLQSTYYACEEDPQHIFLDEQRNLLRSMF